MFGRKPKLPIDSIFEQVTENSNRTTKEYIEDLHHRMETTRKIVLKHLDAAKDKQKADYDKKARAAKFSIGERVLVKVLAFEGKHKIQDRFEEDIYTVIEQPNERIPVYRVRSETSNTVNTLHRNRLFPIGDRKMEKPVPKKRLSLGKGNKEVATEEDEEERRKNEQRKGFETKKEEDSSDESDDERKAVGPRFVRGTNLHGTPMGQWRSEGIEVLRMK